MTCTSDCTLSAASCDGAWRTAAEKFATHARMAGSSSSGSDRRWASASIAKQLLLVMQRLARLTSSVWNRRACGHGEGQAVHVSEQCRAHRRIALSVQAARRDHLDHMTVGRIALRVGRR